jgi:hypothetical protein
MPRAIWLPLADFFIFHLSPIFLFSRRSFRTYGFLLWRFIANVSDGLGSIFFPENHTETYNVISKQSLVCSKKKKKQSLVSDWSLGNLNCCNFKWKWDTELDTSVGSISDFVFVERNKPGDIFSTHGGKHQQNFDTGLTPEQKFIISKKLSARVTPKSKFKKYKKLVKELQNCRNTPFDRTTTSLWEHFLLHPPPVSAPPPQLAHLMETLMS